LTSQSLRQRKVEPVEVELFVDYKYFLVKTWLSIFMSSGSYSALPEHN